MFGNEAAGGVITRFWLGSVWAWSAVLLFETIFVIAVVHFWLGWSRFWHVLIVLAMWLVPSWTPENATQVSARRLSEDDDDWAIRVVVLVICLIGGVIAIGYLDRALHYFRCSPRRSKQARRILCCRKYHEPEAQTSVCASSNNIFSVVPAQQIPSLREGDEASCITNPCEMDEAQPAQNMGDLIFPHVVQLGDQALVETSAHETSQFGACLTSDSLSLVSDETRDTFYSG
eukprot:CAMPEP_0169303176 /NCGR_PEP_ID=MMETSP1016-20121227/69208_1 /TAXON_ID=342587 /ORGANISM="Karlodinium micrum, Strain CCMP2283" /LENGTH=230 /DNA_ID=CAMNT_0009395965 /DNA_START=178 /DNA_END=866 /DNA_ORIENTATION=-